MSKLQTHRIALGFVAAVMGATLSLNSLRATERFVQPGKEIVDRIGGDDGESQDKTVEIKAKLIERTYSEVTGQQKNHIDGPNHHWYRFFQLYTYEDKADALWKSVDGMTYSAAYAIVRAGYLESRPESWADFAREMQEAQRTIKENFYRVVCIEKKAGNEVLLFGHTETIELPGKVVYTDKELKVVSATINLHFVGMDLEFPASEKIEITFDGQNVKVVTQETEIHSINDVKVEKKAPRQYDVTITGTRKAAK